MEIRIRELCDERGIKTAYQLAQKSGLKEPTAYRAFANDIKMFNPSTLEALCRALDCTPNDIFGYESSQNKPVDAPEIGKGNAVRVESFKGEMRGDFLVIDGENYLNTKQVAERINRKPRTVIDLFKMGKLARIKRGQENFVAESVLQSFIDSQGGN